MRNTSRFLTAFTALTLFQLGCAATVEPVEDENTDTAQMALKSGEHLFDRERFAGNGRRCVTCHSNETGTFSPQDVKARLAANSSDPNKTDPLFRHDGLDDGFAGTSRITEHATIRVEVALPPHVKLANDPTATSVVLNRGVPTTKNTPALDPFLMYDGRDPDLQEQARGAIMGHAQATKPPTDDELDAIATFQQTHPRFFSSDALRRYADGTGPAPELPQASTPAEQRGRDMFVGAPFDPSSTKGICALCHSGPTLNESNVFASAIFGAPPGARFFSVGVSERNLLNNPVHDFLVEQPDGTVVPISSADPGVLLTDPLPPEFPPFLPNFFATNFFKTPILWGINETAPYFHDNSAKTLEAVAGQYVFFFQTTFGMTLTAQDQADMVAFMKLL